MHTTERNKCFHLKIPNYINMDTGFINLFLIYFLLPTSYCVLFVQESNGRENQTQATTRAVSGTLNLFV